MASNPIPGTIVISVKRENCHYGKGNCVVISKEEAAIYWEHRSGTTDSEFPKTWIRNVQESRPYWTSDFAEQYKVISLPSELEKVIYGL